MHIGWNTQQFVTASIAPFTLRLFYAMQHILSAERLRRKHPTLIPIWDRGNTRDGHCKDGPSSLLIVACH